MGNTDQQQRYNLNPEASPWRAKKLMTDFRFVSHFAAATIVNLVFTVSTCAKENFWTQLLCITLILWISA